MFTLKIKKSEQQLFKTLQNLKQFRFFSHRDDESSCRSIGRVKLKIWLAKISIVGWKNEIKSKTKKNTALCSLVAVVTS
jgi:hypothetical protein